LSTHLTFPVTTTRYIPWVEFVFPSENWPVIARYLGAGVINFRVLTTRTWQ